MRITKRHLEYALAQLNEATDAPVSGIGSYHLSQEYGGWELHRVRNAEGGVTDAFDIHAPRPARQMLELMRAFTYVVQQR